MRAKIIAFLNWLFFDKPMVKVVDEEETQTNLVKDDSINDDEIVATDFVKVPEHVKTTYKTKMKKK